MLNLNTISLIVNVEESYVCIAVNCSRIWERAGREYRIGDPVCVRFLGGIVNERKDRVPSTA
jgi:hypothetical protein